MSKKKKIIEETEFIVIEATEIPEITAKDFETILITGETGSGKTYKGIKTAAEKGKFVILVPTRQLAYEIYLNYKEMEAVMTGEVEIGDIDKAHGIVGIYEMAEVFMNLEIKTLIVDEAHFLNDEDRGPGLLETIVNAINKGIKVILLTATDTISDELREFLHINEIHLEPFEDIKRVELESPEDVAELVKNDPNITVLVFTKYIPTEHDVSLYAFQCHPG